MGIDASQLLVLPYAPWHYTTQPTYDAEGNELTPGVRQSLDGVFVMLSDPLVDHLKELLTAEERAELDAWVNRYPEAQLATWHAPCWAGQSSAVYLRVPESVWADPADPVPLKVRRYLRELFRPD